MFSYCDLSAQQSLLWYCQTWIKSFWLWLQSGCARADTTLIASCSWAQAISVFHKMPSSALSFHWPHSRPVLISPGVARFLKGCFALKLSSMDSSRSLLLPGNSKSVPKAPYPGSYFSIFKEIDWGEGSLLKTLHRLPTFRKASSLLFITCKPDTSSKNWPSWLW